MRVINRTELPIAIEGGGVDLRMDRTGDGHSVAWVRLPAGADLRPGLAGLPDDLCPCPHRGYMISGRLVMRSKDGEQTHQAGEAFYWASGHAPEGPRGLRVRRFLAQRGVGGGRAPPPIQRQRLKSMA